MVSRKQERTESSHIVLHHNVMSIYIGLQRKSVLLHGIVQTIVLTNSVYYVKMFILMIYEMDVFHVWKWNTFSGNPTR